MKQIWALTDHRSGTASQVLGVAAHTGLAWTEKKLEYSPLAKLPNRLTQFHKLAGLTKSSAASLHEPWPDTVISAGRRLAPVACYIKQQYPYTKLVHLMDPGMPYHHFDLVVLPEHDHPEPQSNVVTTLGAPHYVDDEQLFAASAHMPINPEDYPHPWHLLCLGGNTSSGTFSLEDTQECMDQVAAMFGTSGTLFITASRRTPPVVMRFLQEKMESEHPNITTCYYSNSYGGENPYRAWLAQAEAIIVTGDSVSMISEAAYTAKPLYIYRPKKVMHHKHHTFVDAMIARGYAKSLAEFNTGWNGGERLNEALRIAKLVREL